MFYFKSLCLFLTFSLMGFFALAQRMEIGVMGGGASYLGDLNQYDPLKISGISAGAFVKVNFDPYWGLGLHYNYGKIKASDSHAENLQFKERNLSFYTPLNEASLLVNFNFFDIYSPIAKKKLSPYLFAGIGILAFEPKTNYTGDKYSLRRFNTEGEANSYKSFVLTIPYGAGLKYRYSENWTIFSQIGYRTPLTDYIDDVSGVYPEKNTWTGNYSNISRALSDRSGELTGVYLGDVGTQRGDFRKRDNYMFVGLGISYTFVSQKCFTF